MCITFRTRASLTKVTLPTQTYDAALHTQKNKGGGGGGGDSLLISFRDQIVVIDLVQTLSRDQLPVNTRWQSHSYQLILIQNVMQLIRQKM